MITQLGYVGIGVKDSRRWREFATSILGVEIVEESAEGTLYLRTDEYHHRFLLHPGGNDDLAYVGWMMPTTEAMDQLRTRLSAAGVRVQEGSQKEMDERKVLAMVHFEDPNGVRLEAFWGLQVRSEEPFRPSRPIAGFNAGNLGLGHIVLKADNIQETVAFYRDVLGLRVSDYIDYTVGPHTFRLAFFHCNPRHHSIAFGELPMPRKLHHFMLELQSIDDVGATYDLCQERDIPLASSLGRHSNDRMVSFYMFTPSGFEVEYGFGGRLVDDATWVVQYHKTASVWGHVRSRPRPERG